MDVDQSPARRLLLRGAAAAVAAAPGPAVVGGARGRSAPFSSFDATVITVLSLLLCVLVVALVLHAVVRCAFRVTRRVCYGQEEGPPGAEASRECVAPAPARKRGIRSLPTVVVTAGAELAGCGSTECAICLAEFAEGERVRVLPRCSHGFHVRCIDRWLAARQTCPTCRGEPFAKPAVPGRAVAPAAVQLQVLVDAGQHETI